MVTLRLRNVVTNQAYFAWCLHGCYWRRAATAASVLSEIIQALLPYKTFQFGDILANLAGTALSLGLAYKLDFVRHRSHSQSSLYEAVEPEYNSTGSSEDI